MRIAAPAAFARVVPLAGRFNRMALVGQDGFGTEVMIVDQVGRDADAVAALLVFEPVCRELKLQRQDRGRPPAFCRQDLLQGQSSVADEPVGKALQQRRRGLLQGLAELQEKADGAAAVVKDVCCCRQQTACGQVRWWITAVGDQLVGWRVLPCNAKRLLAGKELGAGQHRQRKDVDLVRLPGQGKINAVAEPLVIITGQAVNQVKAEGYTGVRQ